MKAPSEKPVSLRMKSRQMDAVKEVSAKTGKPHPAIIRAAVGIGLDCLRKVDYDLAKCVVDAAKK